MNWIPIQGGGIEEFFAGEERNISSHIWGEKGERLFKEKKGFDFLL